MRLIRLIASLSLLLTISSAVEYATLVTHPNPSKWRLQTGRQECFSFPCATVSYLNDIYRSGWAFVEVNVTQGVKPFAQGYAAGFAEANITRPLIADHIRNMVENYCENTEEYCDNLFLYLEKNYNYTLQQIKEHQNDDYWKEIELGIGQVRGMIDGYEGILFWDIKPAHIVRHPIYLLQLYGDLEDLQVKFNRPEVDKVRKGKGHCSALVKLLSAYTDIYFSHVTWTTYASLLRVQKRYSFALDDEARTVSFSGYPGTIVSIDDFILTSAQLAILETTIENHNPKLNDLMLPQTVLYFLRSQAANRMASSGEEWARTFSKFNSGTYNNQWVIVDYKKFRPNYPRLKEGLLTVLEQLPGMTIWKDQTKHLETETYWAGYNRPFYPEIFNKSDGPKMAAKYGDWYTHDKCPRANIFRRDHSKVENIRSMQQLMRSNNYKQDPFSRCDCTPPYSAESAISARSELNSPNGRYPIKDQGFMDQGATDVKITNKDLIKSLQFYAKSGPVSNDDGNPDCPIFQWSNSILNSTVPHYGHPDYFRFETILHKWGTYR